MLRLSKLWLVVITTKNTLVFKVSVKIPDDRIIFHLQKVQTRETRKGNRRESHIWGEPVVPGTVLCTLQNHLN